MNAPQTLDVLPRRLLLGGQHLIEDLLDQALDVIGFAHRV